MTRALLLLVAFLSTAPCSVEAYPRLGFEPLDVRIRTVVERDPRNRSACLIVSSDVGEESQSCWPVEGEEARRTETRFFRLSSGMYVAEIRVHRAGAPDVHARVEGPITVLAAH